MGMKYLGVVFLISSLSANQDDMTVTTRRFAQYKHPPSYSYQPPEAEWSGGQHGHQQPYGDQTGHRPAAADGQHPTGGHQYHDRSTTTTPPPLTSTTTSPPPSTTTSSSQPPVQQTPPPVKNVYDPRSGRFVNLFGMGNEAVFGAPFDPLIPAAWQNVLNVASPDSPLNIGNPFNPFNPNSPSNPVNLFTANNLFNPGSLLNQNFSLTEQLQNTLNRLLNNNNTLAAKLPTKVDPVDARMPELKDISVCSNGDGVCTGPLDCAAGGGVAVGFCFNCPNCGACCKYEFKAHQETNKTVSFFQSPDYPISMNAPYSGIFSIRPRPDVCQVRLDFVDFQLAIDTSNGCLDTNNLEIMSPRTPTGLLGPNNSLFCGRNTGQHVYLDTLNMEEIKLKVKAQGVATQAYRWNIRITQILCRVDVNENLFPNLPTVFFNGLRVMLPEPAYFRNLRAPSGCLQYYRETSGTFENFNFDGTSRMNGNYDYRICLRGNDNNCGVTLVGRQFDIPVTDPACKPGVSPTSAGTLCCTVNGRGFTDGTRESWMGLDSVSDGQKGEDGKFLHNLVRFHFCGQSLGGPANKIVSDNSGPQQVQVYSVGAGVVPEAARAGLGFRISYEINNGACQL